MKTQYQYIHFVKVSDKPKTSVWNCLTRQGDRLGQVRWFGSWRQYCFFPSDELSTVFNVGCLNDIANFIVNLSAVKASAPEPAPAPAGERAGQ